MKNNKSCKTIKDDEFAQRLGNSLKCGLSKMIQHANIVPDIYEAMLYAVCFHSSASGAFLSIEGTQFFDYVVGSYKVKRHSIKGGNHVWEYVVPERGQMTKTAGVWLYNSDISGWLFGVDVDARPDPAFIESVNLAALSAIGLVKEKEKNVEGEDQLTGLWDKGIFYRDLRHLVEISNKTGTKLWLIFIDLNNFKPVNDILGHPMGDRILISQAANIKHAISDLGNTYRYGGDEFAAIITGADEQTIRDVVRRIETSSEQSPGGLKVSASGGAIAYEPGEDVEAFVKRADDEMYAAKRLYKQKIQA